MSETSYGEYRALIGTTINHPSSHHGGRTHKSPLQPTGARLLAGFRQIKQSVDKLKEKVDGLKRRVAPYREIRKSILKTGLSTTGLPQSQRRNEVTHGGNIKEDYFLIMEEENREVTDKWRRAFNDIYGFQLASLEDRLLTAPNKVVEVFNMYGNCRVLHRWKGHHDVKREVLDKCHKLLVPWVTKTEPDDYLQNRSPSLLLYSQIVSLYESG
ncbi:hypothetical protein BDV24DRAFT_158722 [Aspergillus arachidicola]|uniref:Uncharacterized protein n=1 Tax=Aspergillus arachidicola TaxID=656916 RepID=A0A5N6YSC7_9EURO|nr:hypothetical protein BDV24DRAFT_158722 [Aspergillus arachidicola]